MARIRRWRAGLADAVKTQPRNRTGGQFDRDPDDERGRGRRGASWDVRQHPTLAARRRSNREQREYERLPARIEALEQEQAALRAELADTSLYAIDPQRASAICLRDAALDEEI